MSLKNKLLVASGAIAAGMTATPAFADGNYFGGFIGAASVDDADFFGGAFELNFETGLIAGAMVGTHVSPNVRLEGELSYLSAGADCEGKCASDFDTSALQILGNVWFDFAQDSALRPYIGAGAGAAQVSIDGSGIDENEWGWGYQVGAGVRLGATGAFDIGYRYRGVQVDLDDISEEYDGNAHVIQIGWTGEF